MNKDYMKKLFIFKETGCIQFSSRKAVLLSAEICKEYCLDQVCELWPKPVAVISWWFPNHLASRIYSR